MTYTCEDVMREIDAFFSMPNTNEEEIPQEVLAHMINNNHLICHECWQYYQLMKRGVCGLY